MCISTSIYVSLLCIDYRKIVLHLLWIYVHHHAWWFHHTAYSLVSISWFMNFSLICKFLRAMCSSLTEFISWFNPFYSKEFQLFHQFDTIEFFFKHSISVFATFSLYTFLSKNFLTHCRVIFSSSKFSIYHKNIFHFSHKNTFFLITNICIRYLHLASYLIHHHHHYWFLSEMKTSWGKNLLVNLLRNE